MVAQDQYLLQVRNLTKYLLIKMPDSVVRRAILAEVGFEIKVGSSFGLAGLPGCGISTLVRLILRESNPDIGEIFFDGRNISQISMDELSPMIRQVFRTQKPKLDYSKTLLEVIEESSKCKTPESQRRAEPVEVAKKMQATFQLWVNPDKKLGAYSYSTDQLRKVELAVALISAPKLLILGQYLGSSSEERQETLRILREVKSTLGLTCFFTEERLGPLEQVCDTIATIFLGEIVEIGQDVAKDPIHPYSRFLKSYGEKGLDDPEWYFDNASQFGSFNDVSGCTFHPFCTYARDSCRFQKPKMAEADKHRWVACHRA